MTSGRVSVRQVTAEPDLAEVRELCREYRDLLVRRAAECPEIVEMYYNSDDYEVLLSDLPRKHAAPDGAIFLAEIDDRPVGCGMIHRIDAQGCEIKRVYVRPEARGKGVAGLIFQTAMTQAAGVGYEAMKLDTMIWLTEAIRLYGKLGFGPCPPFHEVDPRFAPYIRYFSRDL